MQAVLSMENDKPAGPQMRQMGCPCQRQVVPWLRAVELVQLLAGHPWEKGTCIADCDRSKAARLLCTLVQWHWGVSHLWCCVTTFSSSPQCLRQRELCCLH